MAVGAIVSIIIIGFAIYDIFITVKHSYNNRHLTNNKNHLMSGCNFMEPALQLTFLFLIQY